MTLFGRAWRALFRRRPAALDRVRARTARTGHGAGAEHVGGLLGLLRRALVGAPAPAAQDPAGRPGSVEAGYDAATTGTQNRKHWLPADHLSAAAANSPAVRSILRSRARYECGNNGYLEGMQTTLANDVVGTGPRLQVRVGDDATNAMLEREWRRWAKAARLGRKLWTIRASKMADGEVFGLLVTNRRLPTRVKLDLRVIETDMVADPFGVDEPNFIGGIRYDDVGNPVSYRILRTHPGDTFAWNTNAFDDVPAEFVLHYFRERRPGQVRGVPEITSTLSLGANRRRYTSATVAAAETAANMALVIQTDAPADSNAPTASPYETIEFTQNQATALPEGWKIGQAKPEQPTTTYPQFARELLTETARPLCMPYNIAAGDSSAYNYASGRLDHQQYFRAVDVEQDLLCETVLAPLFEAWVREARLGSDALAEALRGIDDVDHLWLWPGYEHVDPNKEASAQGQRLQNRTSTLKEEFGKRGLDWEEELRQAAREQQLMRELGLAPTSAAPAPTKGPEDDGDDANEKEDGDREDAAEAKARLDAIGLAVRSGLLTPQEADEERTRADLGLPPMAEAVRKAWRQEPARRPVTLAQPGGKNQQPKPPSPDGEDDEEP